AGRLDAERSHQPAREGRDGANGVDPPDRRDRGPVRERRREASGARPVQPRRAAPVAVEVEDDWRRAAREPARQQDGERLVRALDEHRVRPEAAKLARRAKRQQEVKERAVDDSRPRLRDEREHGVAGRAGGGGREHPQLELRSERVELARQALVEGQPVAVPADDQEPRPRRHRAAASVSTCSRRPYTSSGENRATDAAAAPARRARSSGSPRTRRTAAASASASPAGTRRPATPSSTISRTPPVSVATTGVPTASASTRTCGKFSQLDGRTTA